MVDRVGALRAAVAALTATQQWAAELTQRQHPAAPAITRMLHAGALWQPAGQAQRAMAISSSAELLAAWNEWHDAALESDTEPLPLPAPTKDRKMWLPSARQLGHAGHVWWSDLAAVLVLKAVLAWIQSTSSGGEEAETAPPRPVLALAVRASTHILAQRTPGQSVELRIPPFAATQCVAGTRHTRGTPPALVQFTPMVWLELVAGTQSWQQAATTPAAIVSGERSDLQAWLPLVPLEGVG